MEEDEEERSMSPARKRPLWRMPPPVGSYLSPGLNSVQRTGSSRARMSIYHHHVDTINWWPGLLMHPFGCPFLVSIFLSLPLSFTSPRV